MLRIALALAVTASMLPLSVASADEMAGKRARKRVVAVATEQIEVWGPSWRRRLPFYDITDPDWIRPMCLVGHRRVYAR